MSSPSTSSSSSEKSEKPPKKETAEVEVKKKESANEGPGHGDKEDQKQYDESPPRAVRQDEACAPPRSITIAASDLEQRVPPRHTAVYYVWTLCSAGFVSLLIPLGLLLLPYTPGLARRRLSTLNPDGSQPDAQAPYDSVCSAQLQVRTLDIQKSYPGNIAFNETVVLRRRVICVLSNKNFRSQEAYLPSNLPFYFCSCVVFGSFSMSSTGQILPRYLNDTNFLGRIVASARTSPVQTPVLISVGGDESSGANISLALRNMSMLQSVVADFTVFLESSGVNGFFFDWRLPGGRCGDARDRDAFVEFISSVRTVLASRITAPIIVVRVPNDRTAIQEGFDMLRLVNVVDYMAIATTPEVELQTFGDPIGCVGDRAVVLQAHIHFSGNMPYSASGKFCYTLDLSPRTYVAGETRLGTLSLGAGAPQQYSQRAGYVAHFELCDGSWTLPSRQQDRECSLAYRANPISNRFDLAVYKSRLNLAHHISALYGDGLGDTCVALFNLEMDDFRNVCGGGISPHLEIAATEPQLQSPSLGGGTP